jgi:hypothetical protein
LFVGEFDEEASTTFDFSVTRLKDPDLVRIPNRRSQPRTLCKNAMYRRALLALLAIVMSNVVIADVVRRDSVPASYWGAWTTTGSDLSVIELSAKTYTNNEANCAVNWVSETPGATGPIYSAYLQCSSRSERAKRRFPLNLIIWPKSPDEIAVGPSFMRLNVFHRCRVTNPPPTGVARSREMPLDPAQTGSQGECRFGGNM